MITAGYTARLPARSALIAAYGAFVLGLAYAAVSAYWGVGGTGLLRSVGGVFQRAGEHGGVGAIALVWLITLLKLIAAALGPAAVGHPALDRRRHRQIRVLAWAATLIFVVYGGVLSIAGWLVQLGVISAGSHADHYALRWHAYVWDPWFLLWGLLLAAALTRTRPS